MIKKFLFCLLTISAFAQAADQVDILSIDCNSVLGSSGAKARCFEKQRIARNKVAESNQETPKEEMSVVKATAVIEATQTFIHECRIKLDVYGDSNFGKVKPCLEQMMKTLSDGGDYTKAVAVISALGEKGLQEHFTLSEAQALLNKMQEVVKDKEYILYKMSLQ